MHCRLLGLFPHFHEILLGNKSKLETSPSTFLSPHTLDVYLQKAEMRQPRLILHLSPESCPLPNGGPSFQSPPPPPPRPEAETANRAREISVKEKQRTSECQAPAPTGQGPSTTPPCPTPSPPQQLPASLQGVVWESAPSLHYRLGCNSSAWV